MSRRFLKNSVKTSEMSNKKWRSYKWNQSTPTTWKIAFSKLKTVSWVHSAIFLHTDLPTSKEIRFTSKQIQDPCTELWTRYFPFNLRSQTRSTRQKWNRERWGSITYGSDRQEVINLSGVFTLSLVCLTGTRNHFKSRGRASDFKWLKHVKSKTSQFEIVAKSLRCLNFKKTGRFTYNYVSLTRT